MIDNAKVVLCIRFIILIGLININNITPLYAEQIYKWVDDNGVMNYSNLPSNMPKNLLINNKNKISESETDYLSKYELEQQRKDYFYRLKKLQAQRNLINEIREIANREQNLQEEFKEKQNMAIETKREFDIRIIQGYFADKSIIELKKLETDMEYINYELELLKPKKQRLISIARNQGIKENLF